MGNETYAIEMLNITKRFPGIIANDNVTLQLKAGEIHALLGENGAGKSTLLRGILGLIRPTGGHIHFHLPPSQVGYLPQQTPIQRDFPASVTEVVLSGLLAAKGFAPFYSRADREKAMEKLRLLGAENLAGRCYRELSGGQQQRVLLARALCAAGRLLLMDEPFTGLDPTVANELYEVVDRLNREEGVTVIMVTHDVPEALRHATRILHLGAQHFDGTAEEYRRSPLYRRLMGGESHA